MNGHPGKYNLRVEQPVSEYIDAESKSNHRVLQCWSDLLNRICLTGFLEGTATIIEGQAFYTFVAEGAAVYYIPTIQISYFRDDDDIVVFAALIWQDGDYEDQI